MENNFSSANSSQNFSVQNQEFKGPLVGQLGDQGSLRSENQVKEAKSMAGGQAMSQ